MRVQIHIPVRVSSVAVGASLALACAAGAAAAPRGGSGGIGDTGVAPPPTQVGFQPASPGCPNKQLGRRILRLGDCGGDVTTLNWILRAKDTGRPPLLGRDFEAATEGAVERFQRRARLQPDGVVDPKTSSAIAESMPPQRATWYGPGFFGNRTACGETLTRRTLGVAHRTLPCGSKVVLRYDGRYIRTTVIDRGPFANGARWDLTQATAQALRFEYTDDVRVAKIPAPTRPR